MGIKTLGKSETWFYKGDIIEIVNCYNYMILDFVLTAMLFFDTALDEFTVRAKGKVVEFIN